MAAMNSFDITSEIDMQEVDNAINQARKEVGQRYDFKGSPAAIELDQKNKTMTLTAEDKFKVGALWEIVQTRMIRRGVPVQNLKPGDVESASAGTVKQVFTLQVGIPTETAKEIVKFLKDAKLKKVQASIQADQDDRGSERQDHRQQFGALVDRTLGAVGAREARSQSRPRRDLGDRAVSGPGRGVALQEARRRRAAAALRRRGNGAKAASVRSSRRKRGCRSTRS